MSTELWSPVYSSELYKSKLKWFITEDASTYLDSYLFLTLTNLKTINIDNHPLTRIELGAICKFKYDFEKKILICRTSIPLDFIDSKTNIGLKEYYLKFRLSSIDQYKYPPIPAYLIKFKECIDNENI